MMRTPIQPLAHLVDAAAERWLEAKHASEQERLAISNRIIQAFPIGKNPKLTFHGLRYLLSITGIENDLNGPSFRIEVHEIALND